MEVLAISAVPTLGFEAMVAAHEKAAKLLFTHSSRLVLQFTLTLVQFIHKNSTLF